MLPRRDFLKTSAASTAVAALSNPIYGSEHSATDKPVLGKAEHCVVVWLGGGAGQIDTWDPKRLGDPKTKKPGSYYPAIDTAIPGTKVCEHFSRCAPIMDRFNLVRTVHHDVIDEHAAATNRMHTGHPTSETLLYPSVGSVIAQQRGSLDSKVPPYILIGYPSASRGPGYLGAQGNYVYLTDTQSGPAGLARALEITSDRQTRREELLSRVRQQYLDQTAGTYAVEQYDAMIGEALRYGGPEFMRLFKLEEEPGSLRDLYGGEFGQRCLLTRRLLQAGVRFVEVSHNLNFLNGTGWDVHNKGILNQHKLIQELDQALAALITDLENVGLFDKTLIVVMGEFGRPAGFDGGGGRGHHGKCFTVAMAGGGLKNGITIGETDELAMEIVSRPVSVPDLHATMYATLGINPAETLYAGDRPVPMTNGGKPIAEIFV